MKAASRLDACLGEVGAGTRCLRGGTAARWAQAAGFRRRVPMPMSSVRFRLVARAEAQPDARAERGPKEVSGDAASSEVRRRSAPSARASERRAGRERLSRGERQQQQGLQRRYREDPVYVQRSLLVGKPVITRTTGTNLGVVNQMWVDTKAWRVRALDVRPNMFYGDMDSVMLESLKQIGDVILVHDESDAQRQIVVYGLSYLIGFEVVSQVGGYLGKVRDFTFNPEDGRVVNIHFDSVGSPILPQSVLSTYSISSSEIVNVGPDRIVVAAGAEERIQQLSSGILQRLALYEPPWEAAYREAYEMDYYGGGYGNPYEISDGFNYQRADRTAASQQSRNFRESSVGRYPYPDAPQQRQQGEPVMRRGRQQQQQQQRQEQRQQRRQQRWEDFVEVDEPMTYEAQVLSQRSKEESVPMGDAYARYNKDEDRL